MIKTKLVQIEGEPDRTIRLFDRRTNELIVTEDRDPAPFRALPRQVRDRILGNEKAGIVGLETSKAFLVRYQEFTDKYVTAVRCWKCGRLICAYQPALRKVEGKDKTKGEVTVMTSINGQSMVIGALLPFHHYREGLFSYRTQQGRLANFSYLHCADCHIGDEHGEDLLACLLGQIDARRDYTKTYMEFESDDSWAQTMFRWSGIELVGKYGASLGPKELMEDAAKRKG